MLTTIPIIIVIVLMVLLAIPFLVWIVPEAKNDNRWYAYNRAYKEWYGNGQIGKMPTSKDFGWIPPNHKK